LHFEVSALRGISPARLVHPFGRQVQDSRDILGNADALIGRDEDKGVAPSITIPPRGKPTKDILVERYTHHEVKLADGRAKWEHVIGVPCYRWSYLEDRNDPTCVVISTHFRRVVPIRLPG
jgi:hypothetical protein